MRFLDEVFLKCYRIARAVVYLSSALVTVLLSPLAQARTIDAASCAEPEVRARLAEAVTGDTVLLPACPDGETWTSVMDSDCVYGGDDTLCNKAITIQGAGVGQTVIYDGVDKSPFPNVPHLIRWNTIEAGDQISRITGIEFRSFAGGDVCGQPGKQANAAMVLIRGNSHVFRFDHSKGVPTKACSFFVSTGDVRGVVDHNVFDVSATAGFAIYSFHFAWDGVGDFGDNSWAQPTEFGTAEAMYYEDNEFVNDGSVQPHYYCVDGWGGARVVYRHNRWTGCTWANHGTESGGRQRSMRQFEIYENDVTWDLQGISFPSWAGSRGGVGVVYDNRIAISNGTLSALFDMEYYRFGTPYWPWGRCDGTSTWDENAGASASPGFRCLDQTGVGQGDLLGGDLPTNLALGSEAWPRQATDPTYIWNNQINGTVVAGVANNSSMVEGRDFFNGTPRPGYSALVYPHPLISGDGGGGGATDAGVEIDAGPVVDGDVPDDAAFSGNDSGGGAGAGGDEGCGCHTSRNGHAPHASWLVVLGLLGLRRRRAPRRSVRRTRTPPQVQSSAGSPPTSRKPRFVRARRAGWILAAITCFAVASSGCFTYYVGSKSFDHEPTWRTGAILFSSEVVAGAVTGAIVYAFSNPKERLTLAKSSLVTVGMAFVVDIAIGGVVALASCIGNDACDQ